MFTGIITHLGKLTREKGPVFTFIINPAFCKKINIGTSIAINGVCLTVIRKPANNSFSIEVMPETLDKTTLGQLKTGNPVNLELPVTPQTYLSGHIVQGHIDTVVKLLDIKVSDNSKLLKFSAPPTLTKYIVSKGSIAINGISLTIIDAEKDYFTVGVIPHTLNHTTLKTIKTGDLVNIEVDILAKYLERLIK